MRTENRRPGTNFTPNERTLLDLLCEGETADFARAREQLKLAKWSGYAYDTCECFTISVPGVSQTQLISHNGGPLSLRAVERDGEVVGFIELWVIHGQIHSLDYLPFADDHTLPDATEII